MLLYELSSAHVHTYAVFYDIYEYEYIEACAQADEGYPGTGSAQWPPRTRAPHVRDASAPTPPSRSLGDFVCSKRAVHAKHQAKGISTARIIAAYGNVLSFVCAVCAAKNNVTMFAGSSTMRNAHRMEPRRKRALSKIDRPRVF